MHSAPYTRTGLQKDVTKCNITMSSSLHLVFEHNALTALQKAPLASLVDSLKRLPQ